MWPAELKKGWSVEVGEGYSSPIAGDGRVFVHARRDPDEVVFAIDLTTGKVAWQQKYAAPIEKNPYAKQMAKGPYSTPLLADGRLYTLGTTAILSAWNAATGELVWRKDFSSRIDTSKLFCGTAMSPLQTTSGIVVHVGDDRGGSILALDPATGKEKWTTAVRGPGYASPIEVTLAGVPQIVTMTTRSVIGVDTATGTLLWEFPFDDEWNENIVTPIATPTGVIVSGVRQGTRRLTVAKVGEHLGGDGSVAHAGRGDVYELAGARPRDALRPLVEAQGTVRGDGSRHRQDSLGHRGTQRDERVSRRGRQSSRLPHDRIADDHHARRSCGIQRGPALHGRAKHDLRAADRPAQSRHRAGRVERHAVDVKSWNNLNHTLNPEALRRALNRPSIRN